MPESFAPGHQHVARAVDGHVGRVRRRQHVLLDVGAGGPGAVLNRAGVGRHVGVPGCVGGGRVAGVGGRPSVGGGRVPRAVGAAVALATVAAAAVGDGGVGRQRELDQRRALATGDHHGDPAREPDGPGAAVERARLHADQSGEAVGQVDADLEGGSRGDVPVEPLPAHLAPAAAEVGDGDVDGGHAGDRAGLDVHRDQGPSAGAAAPGGQRGEGEQQGVRRGLEQGPLDAREARRGRLEQAALDALERLAPGGSLGAAFFWSRGSGPWLGGPAALFGPGVAVLSRLKARAGHWQDLPGSQAGMSPALRAITTAAAPPSTAAPIAVQNHQRR